MNYCRLPGFRFQIYDLRSQILDVGCHPACPACPERIEGSLPGEAGRPKDLLLANPLPRREEAVEKLVWMIDSRALMGYYGDKKDLLLGGGSDGS
jgi:hypothetical protein